MEGRWSRLWLGVVLGAAFVGQVHVAHAQQRVLGPGLYVFQTRITGATCGDADHTGYVNSYFAAVDGIPASMDMDMKLMNSSYWPSWDLHVDGQTVRGTASNERINGTQRVEMRVNGSRFTGTGTRTYSRGNRRCEVQYDALLRKLHD